MSQILEGLNTEQKEAVTSTQGPLLVIAGAGTGKTTVISRRIAFLIEKKLAKPNEILALTFTEKAAAEMEERVDVLLPYGYVDTWISTFHAFGNRVLEEKALELGFPTDFTVLTKPQQVLFVRQNLFSFDLNYFRPLSNPTKFIEAMLTFVSRCKDEDISEENYRKFVNSLEKKKKPSQEEKLEIQKQNELATFYSKYEQLKIESGKFDYGDQVVKVLSLFREKPNILKEYRTRFKYILVDEYQDTNYAQNELVKILTNGHKNLCVVGDDDQSIYKFRGASISNILKFKQDYPNAKQVVLSLNYRSTQSLLDSSYRLIRFNDPDRLEVKNNISKKLVSTMRKSGEPPIEKTHNSSTEETDFIAQEIGEIVDNEKTKYKDIAVLVRANAQAEGFIRSLNLKGIPNKFAGSSGLYDQEEIGLLISFLNCISNFSDSLSLYSLATSEIYQLPLKDLIILSDYSRKTNKNLHFVFNNFGKISELEISEEAGAILTKINEDLEFSLEQSRKYNVGKVLYKFLERTGYLTRLEREGNVEAEIKIQNIAKFFDKIREFIDLSNNESVKSFIEFVEAMRSAGDDPATAEYDPELNAVNIMTVHAAKGLEFKVVFMVGLVSDRFPSRERADLIPLPEELIKEVLPSGDFHVQEERRLFYVGSTRAKEKLYYTSHRDAGGKRLKKISPFVLEALGKPHSEAVVVRKSTLEKINHFASTASEKNRLPSIKRKVITLTQGSVDDYETCAYKYRYAHVLRLPILRHHAVVYGFSLHAAVAEYYKARISGKLLDLENLYEVLEQTWVSEGFLTEEHEEKRLIQAKQVLKAFWEREKENQNLPTFIERSFRFSLRNKDYSVLVNGRYDRVDVFKDKVRIIDYKSTENRTAQELEKNAKDSIQLKIYTLAYFKNTLKVPDFVGIYDLDSGLVAGYEPDEKIIHETEEQVIEVARKIRENLQEDHFPANPKYFGRQPACNYCAYNSICPFSLAK